ncbi:MAG: WhiB family transcriptional regulator, redox-sensing transcriptional regulator [Mycobacterium sp.]|nr:WhiB family transcriptional regulator, redox-sensing transcriptional regulator [Mycobacterium sp.]
MHDHKRPTAAVQLRELNVSVTPTVVDESSQGACTRDPDRWTTTADEGAKALCRACSLRWRCAQDACTTPGAEGVWAGILIPESGRARRFALRQLRSLAELNGYPVRKTG